MKIIKWFKAHWLDAALGAYLAAVTMGVSRSSEGIKVAIYHAFIGAIMGAAIMLAVEAIRERKNLK